MTSQSAKEVFLITSFCDNEEKIQLLKETLQYLKPLNLPLCVHDPVGVEENLIKAGADYLVVDPSNPIPPLTQRSIYATRSLPCNDDIVINSHSPDIGSAAVHQLQSGLIYLSSLGYDVVHVINYDVFIDHNFFSNMASPKALKYAAVLYCGAHTKNDQGWSLCCCFYSINLHRCDKIIRSMSFADYITSTSASDSFESYVERKILDSIDLAVDKVPFQDVKDLIYDKYSAHFDEGFKEKYQLTGHTKVFIESSTPKTRFWFGRKKTLEIPSEGPASVIFYDIQEAFEAKLIVNGQIFETKVEKPPVPDYFLLESTIKGNNIESAQVIIDGDVVVDEIYDNFLLNSIEFKKNEKLLDLGSLAGTEFGDYVYNEVYVDKIYERLTQVEKGDVVVDIGASFGPFTYSILHKEPSKVFCIEPSVDLLPLLTKNVKRDFVSIINKGISGADDTLLAGGFSPGTFPTITFQTFIRLNKITTIDFLKTDCEGGEYDIFNSANFEWIKSNVKKIAGEWHLNSDDKKAKFRWFRDHFLSLFSNYKIFSIDDLEITEQVHTEDGIAYYTEVLVHIDNRS
tara:strand:- start:1043 stop:2752 length:1710 start_codon:yes stop_codon:yes gene_type:complete